MGRSSKLLRYKIPLIAFVVAIVFVLALYGSDNEKKTRVYNPPIKLQQVPLKAHANNFIRSETNSTYGRAIKKRKITDSLIRADSIVFSNDSSNVTIYGKSRDGRIVIEGEIKRVKSHLLDTEKVEFTFKQPILVD